MVKRLLPTSFYSLPLTLRSPVEHNLTIRRRQLLRPQQPAINPNLLYDEEINDENLNQLSNQLLYSLQHLYWRHDANFHRRDSSPVQIPHSELRIWVCLQQLPDPIFAARSEHLHASHDFWLLRTVIPGLFGE
jgi:hypothetical protein